MDICVIMLLYIVSKPKVPIKPHSEWHYLYNNQTCTVITCNYAFLLDSGLIYLRRWW